MNILYRIRVWWLGIKRDIEKYPIYSEDIKKLLKKKFKDCYIECEDNKYYTCDYDTVTKLAPLIPLSLIKYKKEKFDCDDYSRLYWTIAKILFPLLPIGRCNVKRANDLHSLNFIIYRTLSGRFSFTFIEPQTSKVSYWNYSPYLIQL